MTATTTTSYAHAVRAALDDLPAATVAELVDGLEEHLAEVGDDNTTLAELLGPPDRYAAELRATAGLPPRPARTVGASATPWPAPTGPIARVRSITVSSRHVARGGLALLAAVALWWLALVTEGPTVVAAALGAIALWVLLRLVRRAELSVRATHGATIAAYAATLLGVAAGAFVTNNSSTTVFYGPPVTAAPAPFGPATFAMPDLRGLPIARASAVAEQFGLQTSVTGGWTDPGAATAVVVEQYPPAGASVSPGQSVRVMLAHAGGFATTSAPPTTVTAPTTVPTTSTSIP